MGVALNRFLGTFIVLENVENRIKTLFWDSRRPWFGRKGRGRAGKREEKSEEEKEGQGRERRRVKRRREGRGR